MKDLLTIAGLGRSGIEQILALSERRDLGHTLAGEGVAVLVSSHVLGELDELADRAVLMNGGRTVDVLEDVGVGGLGSDVPGSRPRP